MGRLRHIGIWGLALALAAFQPGFAQAQKTTPITQAPVASPDVQAPVPSTQPIPDAYKLNLLIRSSIIALNQANQTGNYTVLQDLAAPSFRASNSSAKLMLIFANLRQRRLDLAPILFFTPKLVRQPMIDPNGILRLVGYFPTSPERVNFDLYFQLIEGDWRIFGIGVVTSPSDVTAAVAPQTQDNAGPQQAQSQNNPAPTPPPARKPASAKQSKADGAGTSVQERTTNNATQIDLSAPKADAIDTAQEAEASNNFKANEVTVEPEPDFWAKLNPFAD
ncbi:MAG: hypothetical protein HC850_15970 [Rhodomicrobium sp.]|nr:hypothetical protein [Rhodomicrobium sp.]